MPPPPGPAHGLEPHGGGDGPERVGRRELKANKNNNMNQLGARCRELLKGDNKWGHDKRAEKRGCPPICLNHNLQPGHVDSKHELRKCMDSDTTEHNQTKIRKPEHQARTFKGHENDCVQSRNTGRASTQRSPRTTRGPWAQDWHHSMWTLTGQMWYWSTSHIYTTAQPSRGNQIDKYDFNFNWVLAVRILCRGCCCVDLTPLGSLNISSPSLPHERCNHAQGWVC